MLKKLRILCSVPLGDRAYKSKEKSLSNRNNMQLLKLIIDEIDLIQRQQLYIMRYVLNCCACSDGRDSLMV